MKLNRDFQQAYLEEKKAREQAEKDLQEAKDALHAISTKSKNELHALQQQLDESQLLLSIAELSREKITIKEALNFFIRAVCELYNWPVGHIYWVDERNPSILLPSDIWYLRDQEKFGNFKSVTETMMFKVGIGLPGRVLEKREACWIENIEEDKNFLRGKISGDLGLKAAFAVPVISQNKMIAVAEFFNELACPRNNELLIFLESSSSQLTTLIDRKNWENIADEQEKKSLEQQRKLEYLAYHDSLTDLPNRVALDHYLVQAIEEMQSKEQLLALFFIGLDNFKSINDSLGHSAGDELLKHAAKRLKELASDSHFVARLNGDEFVFITKNLTNSNESTETAKQLLRQLRKPYDIKGQEVRISASIGVACYPFAGEKPDSLQMNADIALSRAKSLGRNNYQYFQSELYEDYIEQLNLQKDLNLAMERSEFFLVYQPKYRLSDKKLIGAEALVRWKNEERGLVPPDTFIPIAERSGLILPLGYWIFKQACQQYSDWFGVKKGNFKLAINLSTRQLLQEKFLHHIEQLIKKVKLSPHSIVLELTETALMSEITEAEKLLFKLKKMGFHISIDDFGTGYSSLSYLKNLPISSLKIDKSFVKDVAKDPNDATIVKSTISLARNLGLNVIAEGIEKEEQLNFLIHNHCNEGQGYYFSKPLSAEKMTALLKREKLIQTN